MSDKRDAVQSVTDSVLIFIQDYQQAHGVMPSQREIAEGCYMSQPAVVRHLDRLEQSGMISREPGKARSIRLLFSENVSNDNP